MRKNNAFRSTRLITAASIAVIIAAAGGCSSGNGKYTTEHMSGAKIKMQGMKAATEYQMSEQAFLAGDLTKAAKHVDISISMNDKVAKSYVLRGRIKMEQGNIEDAIVSFKKAEETDSKNVEAQYYQGIIAERITRYDEALAYYQKATELDATNPQFVIAAAETLVQLQRVSEAESLLSSKLTVFDHNAGIRQSLGQIAVLQKKPEKAVNYFNEARILASDDRTILEDLARAEMAAGDFGQAERHFFKLLRDEKLKDRRDLKHLRAQALAQIDRPVDARNVYLDLVTGEDGEADVGAWIGLGEVAAVLRDGARLKQASGRVIALAPNRPEGYVLRSIQLREGGDLKLSETYLQKAIALQPSPKTYVLLGMVQQQQQKLADARLSYQQALQQDPSYEPAKQLLLNTTVADVNTDQ
jgi:tetratricopeptide (TPR) repeat protein